MKSFAVEFLTVLYVFCVPADASQGGELRLAKIFNDHMILQQEKPIKIWGWAQAGATVAVTLTQDAEVALAAGAQPQADKGGAQYSVTVQYVETNAPELATRKLAATAGADGRFQVQFEPALASFRPTWILVQSEAAQVVVHDILIGEIWICAGQSNMAMNSFNRKDREGPSSDYPGLRYIAWHDSYYKPLDDVRQNIRWQRCSPETVGSMSSVPYLYGAFLHRYLKVPMGIINVARGGTLGQAWCTRTNLDGIDDGIMDKVLKGYDEETGAWDDEVQLAAIMANWEKECDDAKSAHEVKVKEASISNKPEPRLRMPKKPGDPRSGWSPPAGLFNATVMPIKDLGIRGVLYYQGENNNFMRWTRYESTFPLVPDSFRDAFGDEELPFGCISQPGWGTHGIDPEEATIAEGYAIVRDIQRRALAGDENAAMIATYPSGNSYIHPGEKMPVAEYASLWALARIYDKPVQYTGNTYREMAVRDDKVNLYFDIDPLVYERWKHIEDNAYWQVVPCPREGKADFEGFIIAGADRRWYPAKGRHAKVDGQWTVELSSDLVKNPVAARYGWANWPTGNMVGRNRIPMPTFRTDDWPIPRGVNYTKAVEQESKKVIDELRAVARKQAMDRKIRQAGFDVPRLEEKLYQGDVAAQLGSKVGRLEDILAELQGKSWLANQINRRHADVAEQLKALSASLAELKAKTDAIGDE